jgi:pimeloyl-ACP methyl ester carboxylesterase/membrane protein DedA with SNARE-associated domain
MKRSWKFSLTLGYALLLLASWLMMSLRHPAAPVGGTWTEVSVPLAKGKQAALHYRKIIGTNPSLPPVLLLHGSPMASSCFDPMLKELPGDRTVLVPDLPGFGASSYGFTDFSFKAHAAALLKLLEHEKTSTLHVVAYSQGGGPALELSATHPEKFASLTLLSSIGVQEQELSGDYFINHVLHGTQLLLLEGLRWGLPHFGLLDDFMVNTRYARNFFYGDMRPLRGHLEKFAAPTLILQGDQDILVRPAAAREHQRIVPQSELVLLSGGHMILMGQPGQVSVLLTEFFHEVEAGKAVTKSQAPPARVIAAQEPSEAVKPMSLMGGTLLITSLGIALATLASEDLACLAAGLLVARGLVPLSAAIIACFLGIWIGDIGLYLAGRFGGRWLVKRAPLRWLITPASLQTASTWLHQRGGAAIFASRFMPGTRLPLYVAAGLVKLPFTRVIAWFAVAALIWAVPVVTLIAFFGHRVSDGLIKANFAVFPAVLLFLVIGLLSLRLVSALTTHQGRRVLRSHLERLRRWEFWPPFVFYPPVVLAVIIMGLRRRNLLAFTAANPGIPHSGIAGESKSLILEQLQPSGSVLPFLVIRSEQADRLSLVRAWRTEHSIGLPLVVKPDQGERGRSVIIARTEAQLTREILNRTHDFIVQAYAPGPEFGIFYMRHPSEAAGRIFSVTLKQVTSVTGDGNRTLEELILDDSRAYLSHKLFRKAFADRLSEIPSAGEVIALSSLGSHCRGALFLNGAHLITPSLEAEIHRIASCFEGFHFGRFDLKCASEASLSRGEGLQIIELNGVTSEATHIYHPHTPLMTGYRTLFQQWRHAMDIGLANANAGARVTTWREFRDILCKLWRETS